MAVSALMWVHGSISLEVIRNPESLKAVSESRLGLFIVIVIPQIALVLPCAHCRLDITGPISRATRPGARQLAGMDLGGGRGGDASGRHGLGARRRDVPRGE